MAYTDAFPTTGNLSASWTTINGSFYCEGGGVHASSAAECGARYSGGTFANDQYAQIRIAIYNPAWMYIGVSVRGGATSFYSAYVGGNGATYECILARVDSGVFTQISTTYTGAWAVNDILRLEVVGSTLTVKQNGVTRITGTDANLSSGQAGISGNAITDPALLLGDDWEGGDLGAAPVPFMYSNRGRNPVYRM